MRGQFVEPSVLDGALLATNISDQLRDAGHLTYCGAPKTIKYEEVKLIIRAFETTPIKPREIGNAKFSTHSTRRERTLKCETNRYIQLTLQNIVQE